MHLVRADLHLNHLIFRTNDGGMQRPVIVAFWSGNIIVEFLRDRYPKIMHHAQRGIAVLHIVHKNPYCTSIMDFLEVHTLAFHFFMDAVDVLRAARNLSLDSRLLQFVLQVIHHQGDILFPNATRIFEQCGDFLIAFRLYDPK